MIKEFLLAINPNGKGFTHYAIKYMQIFKVSWSWAQTTGLVHIECFFGCAELAIAILIM